MNGLDFVKALGVALLLMVINVAASFAVVAAYAAFVEPGHEASFYEDSAQWIAPWSSIFVGAALFFLAGLWLSWRRSGRNGFAFAAAFALIYAAIDIAIIAAAGALGALGLMVAGSMASKLVAALLGAWLSRPRP
jgi:hypothetical protein